MTDNEIYLLTFFGILVGIIVIIMIRKKRTVEFVVKSPSPSEEGEEKDDGEKEKDDGEKEKDDGEEDKCKNVVCNKMQKCVDGKCLPEQIPLKYVDCPTKSPNPQCIWKMLENATDKKCISSSTIGCNENSAKLECEQHIGIWTPLDYSANPYTCISSEKVPPPQVPGAPSQPAGVDKKGRDCVIAGVKVGNYKFDDNFSNKCSVPVKDNAEFIGCCNISDNKCTFDFNSTEFNTEDKIKNWMTGCRDKTYGLKDVGTMCDSDSECRSLLCIRTRPMDMGSSKECIKREFYKSLQFKKLSQRSRYMNI
jgi:hypothetical protein